MSGTKISDFKLVLTMEGRQREVLSAYSFLLWPFLSSPSSTFSRGKRPQATLLFRWRDERSAAGFCFQ